MPCETGQPKSSRAFRLLLKSSIVAVIVTTTSRQWRPSGSWLLTRMQPRQPACCKTSVTRTWVSFATLSSARKVTRTISLRWPRWKPERLEMFEAEVRDSFERQRQIEAGGPGVFRGLPQGVLRVLSAYGRQRLACSKAWFRCSSCSRLVSWPGLPSPITRPSASSTGVSSPIVPVVKTSLGCVELG